MHKHDPALDIDGARIKQLLRQGQLLQYLAFKMTCGKNLTELQVVISLA
jgi:hypothetical protein